MIVAIDGTAKVAKNGPRGYKTAGRRIAEAGEGAYDEEGRAPGRLEECYVPNLRSASGDNADNVNTCASSAFTPKRKKQLILCEEIFLLAAT